MKTKLFRVRVTLSASGFSEQIIEATILKEGEKTYHVEITDKWGETQRRYKKKEIIGVIDSGVFNNSISLITYGCWCFEEDIERIKSEAKERVISTALHYKETLDKILVHLKP